MRSKFREFPAKEQSEIVHTFAAITGRRWVTVKDAFEQVNPVMRHAANFLWCFTFPVEFEYFSHNLKNR